MDPRLRQTLRRIYSLSFRLLILAGIGGSSIAVGAAFASSVGGRGGFCFGSYLEAPGAADEKGLAAKALALAKREECENVFVLSLMGSWLPLLGVALAKKLLCEKWSLRTPRDPYPLD